MTEEEILELKNMNCDAFTTAKNLLYENYLKFDHYLSDKQKEIAQHYEYPTRKKMKEAMLHNFNPWSTFSYKKKRRQ